MKFTRLLPLCTLLPLAALAALAAPAGPEPGRSVNSAISAVTVYTDRAVVTRTATVELAGGMAELVFANLPQALNERSLQVSGRGTAQALILDVSAKQTYVDFTPNTRVKELEDQLKGLQKQGRGLDDRSSVLQAQSTMLDRMEAALFAPPTKDVPRPDLNQFTNSLTYLSEQKTKIIAERATLDEQREDLQAKLTAVQNQLNELRGAGGRGYKTVTVRVSAAQAGNLEVALSYTVPGASWSPSYDARVLSGERAVALGYFGIVHQNTGEDWKDVALTLSTARPGLGGAAPVLGVWNLDVFAPHPMPMASAMERREYAAKSMTAPAAAGNIALDAFQVTGGSPAEMKDGLRHHRGRRDKRVVQDRHGSQRAERQLAAEGTDHLGQAEREPGIQHGAEAARHGLSVRKGGQRLRFSAAHRGDERLPRRHLRRHQQPAHGDARREVRPGARR
jgi:hypothetical protein